MTPVAGRIAGAEENRHVSLPGLRKGGGAPSVPVDGIIRVGAQIGGRGLIESIFHEYGLREKVFV